MKPAQLLPYAAPALALLARATAPRFPEDALEGPLERDTPRAGNPSG